MKEYEKLWKMSIEELKELSDYYYKKMKVCDVIIDAKRLELVK